MHDPALSPTRPPMTSQAPAQPRGFYPITYSGAYDHTSSCTTQGPTPALSPTQAHVTAQAPAHARVLLCTYWLLSQQWPPRNLSKSGACFCPTTQSAISYITSKLQKPGAYSGPISYSGTYDITSSCTSQRPALALSYLIEIM